MKRGIIIGLIVLAIGGGIAWFLLGPQQQTNTTPSQINGSSATPTELQGGEVTVRMQNTKFSPQELRVAKGTKVTWVNDDSIQHNVVSSDGELLGGLPTQNPLFGKGGSYSFTFDTVGVFNYHCTPHPFMAGTVTVE